MNRKQKIIISITGIFIVLLALVGLTYAYFLTRITGNENEKSISVTTANLRLVYDDVDDQYVIGEGEIIEPDTTFETKTFTVTNNGNESVDEYAVILEEVSVTYATTTTTVTEGTVTTLGSTTEGKENDFTLVITCKNQDNEECNGYNAELLKESGILLTNSIEVGETQTYTATLTYNETGHNQSADMNKRYNGKFNIIDTKDTIDLKGTVTNYEEGDYVQTNSTKRVSVIYPDKTYKIMGLEAGTHKIKVCAKNITDCTDDKAKMIETITIKKGNTASVDNATKTITITDDSRLAKVDVDATNGTTINNEIKEYNPFNEGTLAAEIYKNVKLGANGTTFGTPINGVAGTTITSNKVENRTFVGSNLNFDYVDCYSKETGEPYPADGGSCVEGDTAVYGSNSSERPLLYSTASEMAYIITSSSYSYASDGSNKMEGGVTVIKGENILGTAEDDLGTSYYYRGNVQDNYVNFGGKCWRIVRIQGDDSLKLILEDKATTCDSETFTGGWSIGNVTNDAWLESSGINQNQLKEEKWCIGILDKIDPSKPSLKCSGTSEENGEVIKSKINGITMDEAIYASGNSVFTYLINEDFGGVYAESFKTITPYDSDMKYIVTNGSLGHNDELTTYYGAYISFYYPSSRPAIVINNDVLVDAATSGNGTRTNPYVIN